ncbi:hypothetical protein A2U01_0084175, partial [Trifolium medium]|nr:hypothetical protein [Trifolium medium]
NFLTGCNLRDAQMHAAQRAVHAMKGAGSSGVGAARS